VRHRRSDGQYRWFLVRGVPLKDAEGRIVRWYGTSTDIEDRKQAEEELRRQKEVFQKIFEHIPITIAFVGQAGFIELVNPEWERILGWTVEEIRDQNLDLFAEFYPDPQYRQWVLDLIAASTGEWTDRKVRVKDGRVIDWSVSVVHLSDGTSVAIGRDITERKRAEEALHEAQERLARVTRVQAMGELAAAIAHEVNQPLTAIVTNGNFCLREFAAGARTLESLREAIAEIVEDGNRASTVISRIRALLTKGAPDRTELDINEILREVPRLVRNQLTRNRISLRMDLAPDLPRVPGDRVQLQQVVLNLVSNGIDAMQTLSDRPREILIKSAKRPDGVLIQVHDSGPGIDPAHADRIFEPFFTTKPEGIGMGLAIARTVVESHGGHLRAVAECNGATFEFVLPSIDGVS
jgi:PAS domain S-box-containing protein